MTQLALSTSEEPKPKNKPAQPTHRPASFTSKLQPKRRNLLTDSLESEEVVLNAIKAAATKPLELASLVSAFVKLVPLIRALQGRTLFLSGVAREPDKLMLLRAAKRAKHKGIDSQFNGIIDIPRSFAEEPAKPEATTKEAEAISPTTQETKGIS